PLALSLVFLSDKKLNKLIAVCCIGLYIFAIFLTFSRMGFLCLVIILLMTLIRSQQKARNFLFLMLMVIFCLPFVPAKYWQRTSTITEYDKDRSSMGRLEAWEAGIDMMTRNPFFGVGPGCYVIGWSGTDSHGEVRSAHNTFFQVLGELGMVG